MAECAWAVLINALNFWAMRRINSGAEKLPEAAGLRYVISGNAGRIFGLIAGLVGVILWAEINRIYFIVVFILLYIASLLHTTIRYGTNG